MERLFKLASALMLLWMPLPALAETLIDESGQKTLRIRGEAQAGFENRDRDPHTGVSDSGDKQGFVLGRSLLTVEKLFPEQAVLSRLRFLITRADNLDNPAPAKADPYVMRIQQAWLGWQINREFRAILGIQESPMDYSMTRLTWDLDYVIPPPFEALGVTPTRSIAGLSIQGNFDHFVSFNLAVANPQPETESRTAHDTGYDVMLRFSVVPTGRIGRFHFGFHFFYRYKDFFLQRQSDCIEGRSDCLAADNDPATARFIDPRSNQHRTYGMEFTFRLNPAADTGVGFSAGAYFENAPGGRVSDRLHPGFGGDFIPGSTGQVVFAFVRAAFLDFTLFLRRDAGTGNTSRLAAVRTDRNTISAFIADDGTVRNPPAYGDRSYFIHDTYGLDYRINSRWKVAFGFESTRLYDSTGGERKTYIDAAGQERTLADYRAQFSPSSTGQGIAEYRTYTRQYFVRTSIEF